MSFLTYVTSVTNFKKIMLSAHEAVVYFDKVNATGYSVNNHPSGST